MSEEMPEEMPEEVPEEVPEDALDVDRLNALMREMTDPRDWRRVQVFREIRRFPKHLIEASFRRVRQAAGPDALQGDYITDPLQRALFARPTSDFITDFARPPEAVPADFALAVVLTPGYEHLFSTFLRSLRAFGGVPDATLLVFAIDAPDLGFSAEELTALNVRVIPGRGLAPFGASIKGVLYGAWRFTDARYLILCDLDTLVVGSLEGLRATVANLSRSSVAGVQALAPANPLLASAAEDRGANDTVGAAVRSQGAPDSDVELVTGRADLVDRPYLFNGGFVAGHREAMEAVGRQIAAWNPLAVLWAEGGFAWFAEEVLLTLAIHAVADPVFLSRRYNLFSHNDAPETWFHSEMTPKGLRLSYQGQPAVLLHFMSNLAGTDKSPRLMLPKMYEQIMEGYALHGGEGI